MPASGPGFEQLTEECTVWPQASLGTILGLFPNLYNEVAGLDGI